MGCGGGGIEQRRTGLRCAKANGCLKGGETHSAPNQVHAARSCDKRTDQLIPAIDHWISDPLDLTELGIEKFQRS